MRFPKPWYRESRGVWYVTLYGKQHNLGSDREAAFARYRELISAQKQPVVVAGESVACVIDRFLDWAQKHRARGTYEWYRDRCQSFLRVHPRLTVTELRPFHVQEWVDSHAGWSDGHKRGCIIAIQRPLRWALKMGYIEQNPIAHIEKPAPGRREEYISPDNYSQILDHVSDHAFSDLLRVAWSCGPRPQELRKVEARHVDLDNARWVFPSEESKGKKRVRIVYLTDDALDLTSNLMAKNLDGPLFRNLRGAPWTKDAVNCRFARLKSKLGKKYCLYLFRHSFATRMLESGVDALTVAILLGHSDTTMLGKVYQHLSHNPAHLRDQLKRGQE